MGSVIAERELGYAHQGAVVRGRLSFEAPEPDDRCWRCFFEIDLAGASVRRRVLGEDSYQALQLAMRSAVSEIALSDAFKSGQLTIFDEPVQTIDRLKESFGVTHILGFDQ